QPRVRHQPLDRAHPGARGWRSGHRIRAGGRRLHPDAAWRGAHRADRAAGDQRAGGQSAVLWFGPHGDHRAQAEWRVALARARLAAHGAEPMTLLAIDHLTKRFRGLLAVDDVSFRVDAGDIVAIIGPNGAGKTTLFNMIAGVFTPDQGTITFAGERIDGRTPDAICRPRIGRTCQRAGPVLALPFEGHC